MAQYSTEIIVVARKGRLDSVITQSLAYSRSFIQKLIEQGYISVNGVVISKANKVVQIGDHIAVKVPSAQQEFSDQALANIGISIIFEHPDFVIISKPAGLVVHRPRPENTEISVVDWVLSSYKEAGKLGELSRPGIVHRLDKNTSGLMIIVRTPRGYAEFSKLFKSRHIKKMYLALVKGNPPASGSMEFPIGRHPAEPYKMSVTHLGRESKTRYRVREYYPDYALLELYPHTGRTHQLRVHCAALGFPIIGDTLYGTSSPYIKRHALHAAELQFSFDGKDYIFSAPLPQDFEGAISSLRSKNKKS